jgi:hypothetical protein
MAETSGISINDRPAQFADAVIAREMEVNRRRPFPNLT